MQTLCNDQQTAPRRWLSCTYLDFPSINKVGLDLQGGFLMAPIRAGTENPWRVKSDNLLEEFLDWLRSLRSKSEVVTTPSEIGKYEHQ